jgi:DNA-binding response OmpR family regulator
VYHTAVSAHKILHVSSRELIQKLRDTILRIHGFEVESTLSLTQPLNMVRQKTYDLVLIDVEGPSRIEDAEALCNAIKKVFPDQLIAYVCNHRLSSESDCPDEIIRAEFNPELLVQSVKEIIASKAKSNPPARQPLKLLPEASQQPRKNKPLKPDQP